MEPAELAKTARASLSEALSALQSADDVPDELLDAAEPIAKTMGILHKIERSKGAVLDNRDVALKNVRKVLADVQMLDVDHPAVDTVLESVAASLASVNKLAKFKPSGDAAPVAAPQPARQPAPARVESPPPAPEPVHTRVEAPPPAPEPVHARVEAPPPAPEPVHARVEAPPPAPEPVHTRVSAPEPAPQPIHEPVAPRQSAPEPAPVEVIKPVPIIEPKRVLEVQPEPAPAPAPEPVIEPKRVVEVAPAPAPEPAPEPAPAKPEPRKSAATPAPAKVEARKSETPAPAKVKEPPPQAPPGTRTYDVELGTHSSSNFYKGLSGNDVIEHGGVFVATYRIPKLGSQVQLRVLLPGDYEFYALATVQWVREPSGSSEPGFGARVTQIGSDGRQLVYRYARNREPMFYDDL